MAGKKPGKGDKLTFIMDPSDLVEIEKEKEEVVIKVAPDDFFESDEGVEYHVTRILPKGPDEGFINVFPAPFRYEDLKRDYGGGTYRIQKKNSQTKKFLATGTFKIAGPPGPPKVAGDLSGNSFELILKRMSDVEESIKNPRDSSGSVLDPKFFQQLLASKLLLQAGGSNDNSALISFISKSGDNQLKALLQGIELASKFSEGGHIEEEEGTIWDKLASAIAPAIVSVLDRKNLEIKTVNRTPAGVTATHTRVGSEDVKTNLGEEQMVWDNLIEKVENMILDGIENKKPPVEISASIKVIASPIVISMLGGLTPEAMLELLKNEYADNPEVSQMLQLQENQVYLTQILEELKK